MTTGQKWGLGLGITAVILIVIGIIFRKQLASFFTGVIGGKTSCGKQFFVKVSDLEDKKIKALNIIESNGSYYKTEVTLVPDGVTNDSSPIEITLQERNDFCENKFTPSREYAWYYEKAAGGISESNARN